MDLNNKVVLITWASQWIGAAIAKRLAKEWIKLALLARNTQKLQDIAEVCRNLWASEVKIYPSDISNTSKIPELVPQIQSDFWTIDILINNAGIWQKMMQLDEIKTENIDPIIQTNLSGVIHLTHCVLPILRTRNEAAILNIVSQSGVQAQGWQAIYTATKYWVRGFTDVLKTDLKESNVRVAGVYQSGTNTEMFATQDETMPLEKFTDPNDLADVVSYILSQPPKIWLHEVRVNY